MATNKEITTGIKFTGDATGVEKAAARAKKATTDLRIKSEAESKSMKKTFGSAADAVGSIGSAAGGVAGNIASMAASCISPLGLVTAAVGAIAMAWKRSKENVDLYLKSADKLQYGAVGFTEDAIADRKKTRRRAAGGMRSATRESDRAYREHNLGILSDDEYAEQSAGARKKYDHNKALLDQVTGQKDLFKWEEKRKILLAEQEALQDKIEDKAIIFEGLEAKLVKDKMIIADKDTTSAEKAAAVVDAEKTANTLLSEKTALLDEQIASITAIAEMTSTQEDVEGQLKQLAKDRETLAKDYGNDMLKVLKMEAKVEKSIDNQVKARSELVTGISTSGAPVASSSVAGSPDGSKLSAVGLKIDPLDHLENVYAAGLVSTQEYLDEKYRLEKSAAEGNVLQLMQVDKEYFDSKAQLSAQTLNTIAEYSNSMFGVVTDMYEASKNRELEAAGSNEKKKEAIEKKYAKKQQSIAMMQAIMNGALGITMAVGQTGVLSAFAIPLIIATTAAQVSVIASQKFAEGGIVSGETLATVGEYSNAKNNPEVIAPLDKLKSMIGTEGSNITVTGVIKGRDIYLAGARYSDIVNRNT